MYGLQSGVQTPVYHLTPAQWDEYQRLKKEQADREFNRKMQDSAAQINKAYNVSYEEQQWVKYAKKYGLTLDQTIKAQGSL